MGCQPQVALGDYLTFSICTHDPDTGELAPADAAPPYRIYEDETATPILTGTMAALDAPTTTGFYTERILCSAANEFEEEKSYTIYIEAEVDGDTGGIAFSFTVQPFGSSTAQVWGHIPRTLTQTSAEIQAALEGSRITIHRGDDLSVTLTGLGNLAGRTELWYTAKKAEGHTDLRAVIQITESGGLVRILQAAAETAANGSITVDDEDDGDVTIALVAVETAKLSPGQRLAYDIQMLKGGEILTLTESTIKVTADVTRAVTA